MKVLVLGSKGQLGLSLRDHLSGTDHEVVYASREQIDVTDLGEVEEKVTEVNPDFLINASATPLLMRRNGIGKRPMPQTILLYLIWPEYA